LGAYTSEYIYGGFLAPQLDPTGGGDVYVIPTEIRPLNAVIVKPNAQGRNVVDLYVCPSDRSSVVPMVGGGPPIVTEEDSRAAWQIYGNSYPINWYFREYLRTNAYLVDGYGGNNLYYLPMMADAGKVMLRRKIGGPASRFVMFYENAMDMFMLNARPDGSSPLPRVRGWHKAYSKY